MTAANDIAGSALEIIEPQRTVLEVVEEGQRVVYVVEPTVIQPVPDQLADLDDVAPVGPTDGQVLTWDADTGLWGPATPESGGSGGGLTVSEADTLYHRKSVVDAALAGKENTGTAAAAVLAHAAATNPHPQYVQTADLAAYATDLEVATGLAGKADVAHTHPQTDITGLVVTLAGKETAGAASAAVTAHESATDPHPQYLTQNDGDARYGNLFKEAEQDGRLDTLEARTIDPPVTLADAATIATDAALGHHFRVTLGGNRTLGAPTNPADGQRVLWEFTQDATGGRTLTLAAGAGGFLVGADGPVVLSTTPGMRDIIGAIYNAALNRWLVIAVSKGFGP